MNDFLGISGKALEIAVSRAAAKWVFQKEREFSQDGIEYFIQNWRALPGLRAFVARELGGH